MALLMVHLLAARRWVQTHKEHDCPEFYLGVISPDAVYIRDGSDKSHKDEIHLHNWNELHADEVIAYWREHNTPFDIGYGIHVLTDAQWAPHFRRCFPEILYPDGLVRTDIYYNDTFATDYALYHECDGEALFALTEQSALPEVHPLLEQQHFDAWRHMMADQYRNHETPEAPVQFIDRKFVEQFIEDSQSIFDEVYGRYEHE